MSTLSRWLSYAVLGVVPPQRRRSQRKGPARNQRYRAFVRAHPCAACHVTREIEAAHTGGHGISQKSSDYNCIPLCGWCHQHGKNSLHRLGPKEFERFHDIKIGSLIRDLNAEWREIQTKKGEGI